MKKGLNYTEAFEDIHRERFFIVDIKRKGQVIWYITLESFILLMYYLLTHTGIESTPPLIVYTLIILLTFFGVGFDVEDEPLYRYIIYMLKHTPKVVVAGEQVRIKKPYELQLRKKIIVER